MGAIVLGELQLGMGMGRGCKECRVMMQVQVKRH